MADGAIQGIGDESGQIRSHTDSPGYFLIVSLAELIASDLASLDRAASLIGNQKISLTVNLLHNYH